VFTHLKAIPHPKNPPKHHPSIYRYAQAKVCQTANLLLFALVFIKILHDIQTSAYLSVMFLKALFSLERHQFRTLERRQIRPLLSLTNKCVH